jgi:XRE family transcriptional regulator, regulator of sulfur utilization
MNDKEAKKLDLDAGALELSGNMGKTIQRLRKAYSLSLSELSEQSGVAKSIISQIERNETNPTLATIWRLSQALDVSIEKVLQTSADEPFIEHVTKSETPLLMSEDGLCRLSIVGWSKTLEWLQWYDFTAEPKGILESDGHQLGSVESLSVITGILQVQIGEAIEVVKAGESLRYHCDKRHIITNIGEEQARATMILMLKAAVMT